MNLTSPAASVLPALRARVLMVLARVEAGLTGRRVAALAAGSVAGVAKILETLVHGGLVHRIDAGSASLYFLNRDHLGASAVLSLATMRERLIEMLQRRVSEFTHRPLNATLFGSAARGDGDEESDIDLLLVRPEAISEDDEAWTDDIERLATSVLAWTGNPLSVVEYTPADLVVRAGGRDGLLDRINREGVHLHGTVLRALRRRAGVGVGAR
ncbi:MAG TPA: nucleotidyltransferase domain-containing protein [Mycobacteriales bacterium]|nr:nucleotidyltransferase domain-containing protein [Mycobacteriales bacterium]